MSLKYSIATAALFASAGAAASDQYDDMANFVKDLNTPVRISLDEYNSTDYVAFMPVQMVGGGAVHREARVDYELGMICEWNVVTKDDVATIENVYCLDDKDIKPKWFDSYLKQSDDEKELLTQTQMNPPVQSPVNMNAAFESSAALSFLGESYATAKLWDFSTGTVCVQIARQMNYQNEVTVVDLGCQKNYNRAYQETLMRHLGINPA